MNAFKILAFKKFLLEEVTKNRDIHINMFPNAEKAAYYQTWIDQIKNEKVTDDKLKFWLSNHADYYQPKDRPYAEWVNSLC